MERSIRIEALFPDQSAEKMCTRGRPASTDIHRDIASREGAGGAAPPAREVEALIRCPAEETPSPANKTSPYYAYFPILAAIPDREIRPSKKPDKRRRIAEKRQNREAIATI
ncbi:hypothetical protein FGU65_11290 [Methanoculleus sp. FWC-SCC1]|uniref:Uncharacterized protein n=1 Tax=Methanoculleus frigidifontis TaxID=2584085 RepID=A0ABT8MC09_9EURY|nr:hypothetical protein [Methanoculleus sp. FWC-SCC1]MDN7025468.1 hypothetical protein [Methanoculleus sp. FWC-SCC1]